MVLKASFGLLEESGEGPRARRTRRVLLLTFATGFQARLRQRGVREGSTTPCPEHLALQAFHPTRASRTAATPPHWQNRYAAASLPARLSLSLQL